MNMTTWRLDAVASFRGRQSVRGHLVGDGRFATVPATMSARRPIAVSTVGERPVLPAAWSPPV
jgi:hypothetical protein